MEPTVPVGAEAGVSVGTGVVAVGSGVGADESLQALRTPAMPRIVRDCEPADTKIGYGHFGSLPSDSEMNRDPISQRER